MLITELKAKDTILSLTQGKVFLLICHGCKEIHFPEHEAEELKRELLAAGKLTGTITTAKAAASRLMIFLFTFIIPS